MRVHVAGGDRRHAEVLREIAQQRRAAGVAALERPLQLDEEAVAAERLRQPGGAVRVAQAEAIAGAAGEADEAIAVSSRRRRGRPRAAAALSPPSGVSPHGRR